MSGEYKCNVQTFESNDDESGHLQVVIPEEDFQLEQISNEKILIVRCSVSLIYPEPKLILMYVQLLFRNLSKI